jgi:hypothetical protein
LERESEEEGRRETLVSLDAQAGSLDQLVPVEAVLGKLVKSIVRATAPTGTITFL